MSRVLADPVRVAGDRLATVEDGGLADAAQRVAALAETRVGERPMTPGFGTPDPLWSDRYDAAALELAAATYGPSAPVAVTAVDVDEAAAAMTVTVEVG